MRGPWDGATQSKDSISRLISVVSTLGCVGWLLCSSDLQVARKDSTSSMAWSNGKAGECSFLMAESRTSVLVFPSSNARRCGKRYDFMVGANSLLGRSRAR